ncbi:hypothetical protein ALC56_02176 [Trachymyrmex septentrionalis]|uniref:Uncharacterized protein n=1 Tax=Trachymyrmex septentrionalis TaxID=34720 RepID=A0A195FS87_9HYME|nr:hypothetical protein ALC56_02176 [Trachymyrmex septentrionalis]
MSHSLHFLQSRQFLELPLMIEYETVSAWSPSVKVLFAPDICGTRVQDATLTSLNSYKYIGRKNGWVFHNSPAKIDTGEKNKPPEIFPRIIKVSNIYLEIRGDGHEDLFSVGRDSIEQSRVMQRAVPGCFKSEHGSIIARNFEIFAREQTQ